MKEFYNKTEMSRRLDWSEGNGRRWVKIFEEYIPTVEYRNRIMYNNESIKVLTFLKNLHQTGLTIKEIKELVDSNGLPESSEEATRIIEEHKTEQEFNHEDARGIPAIKDILIPYLEVLRNGKPSTASEVTGKIATYFNLTDNQQVMRYKSSPDSIFLTRIRSARYSLKKEGYIDEVNKLTYQITDEGLGLIGENKKEIANEVEELEKVVDPLTIIKEKINELNNQLADSLLKELQKVHWIKFEDIVIELLTEMGYGDGEVTQRTNDEGLDGVIKEDKLGLENIYVQAKRWGKGNSVGREVVQSFSGALDSKGARKGVFITTSHFTAGARGYAEKLESKKIVLIDGKELSKLMISHNVGVDNKFTFVVKDIDFDYFKNE